MGEVDLDAKAEEYVALALRCFALGRPSDALTVGLAFVPAVTRALEREGWAVTPGDRPGRLRVRELDLSEIARAGAVGDRLRRALRARRMTSPAATVALGCDRAELALLRQGRFEEIGAARLAAMARRFEESWTAADLSAF